MKSGDLAAVIQQISFICMHFILIVGTVALLLCKEHDTSYKGWKIMISYIKSEILVDFKIVGGRNNRTIMLNNDSS